MTSLWDEAREAELTDPLDLRVYSSRLIGSEAQLVLHGGGNTSVKTSKRDILGNEEDILYIKGSGWDLATIERQGFAPLRLERVAALASLESMSDITMARELKASLTVPDSPSPSVESILHAIIPFDFVDHTHADAVISLTNTPSGERRIRELYGEQVIVVPYVMPGFLLAREFARRIAGGLDDSTIGVILLNHGALTFGETARKSYERMIELVTLAENYLDSRGAWRLGWEEAGHSGGGAATRTTAGSVSSSGNPIDSAELADLRARVSALAGKPMIVRHCADERVLAFVRREDLDAIARRGPATPDHSIRTKRLPLVGRDTDAYAREYETYFRENAARASEEAGTKLVMLDPAPRVILDRDLGMLCCGATDREAGIIEELYRHTMDIIERATLLEEWAALPAADVFDVEYWSLEQQKLARAGVRPGLEGEIALVTGAASGIGRACAEALLAAGAAVVGLDVDAAVERDFRGKPFLGARCDVTERGAVSAAFARAVERFGGLDILVLNAGVFPRSIPLAELTEEQWRSTLSVNLDANQGLLRTAHPFLRRSPRGGRVVVIGSKNVPAPGKGAGAYSASKAALTQLARVAALEWGRDRIRVNTLHPNAVFDTGIWTPEALEERARAYGLTVEEYKRSNVLGVEVTSPDVARAAVALCGPEFSKTTGAQIPVDGGNDRVI